MAFKHRSYAGKVFRPPPEIHFDEQARLLIVATPWGNPESAKRSIQVAKDYINASQSDLEVTTPFEMLSCLSSLANHLRIAALLANELLYREDNQDEYQAGVEFLILAAHQSELAFALLGSPSIYLKRNNQYLIPLATEFDHSADLRNNVAALSPLPRQMLGLDTSCNLTVNSLRPQKDDQIILISKSHMPNEIFQLASGTQDLIQMSQILSKSDVESPFWLATLDLADLIEVEQPQEISAAV